MSARKRRAAGFANQNMRKGDEYESDSEQFETAEGGRGCGEGRSEVRGFDRSGFGREPGQGILFEVGLATGRRHCRGRRLSGGSGDAAGFGGVDFIWERRDAGEAGIVPW